MELERFMNNLSEEGKEYFENHPLTAILHKMKQVVNKLDDSNLSEQERDSLQKQLVSLELEGWQLQILIYLQIYSGESIANFDVTTMEVSDLIKDPRIVVTLQKFLNRYCHAFNYMQNIQDAEYCKQIDPKAEIPSIIKEALDKGPNFMSKKDAGNIVLVLILKVIKEQITQYNNLIGGYMKYTGEIPEDSNLNQSLASLFELHQKKIGKYSEDINAKILH